MVNDDETWPHYLSELTDTRVLNFGIGAYGTDRALLRLQRAIGHGVTTPIVILAVWSGGLDRLPNSSGPFNRAENGLVLGFKPMLAERGGGYAWLPNPLPWLRDGGEVAGAGGPGSIPVHAARPAASGAAVRDRHRQHHHPWDDERATGRKTFLLATLHRHSRTHDYRPVVVFVPTAGDLRGHLGKRCAPCGVHRRYGRAVRGIGIAVRGCV